MQYISALNMYIFVFHISFFVISCQILMELLSKDEKKIIYTHNLQGITHIYLLFVQSLLKFETIYRYMYLILKLQILTYDTMQ